MKSFKVAVFLCCLVAMGVVVSVAQAPSPKASLKQPTAAQTAASKAPAQKAAKASDLPVVGYLERRGQVITIKAGPKGPLYSVSAKDGKVLFTDLSEKELRAKAPEVHEFLKTAVAGDTPAKGRDLDARVNQQPKTAVLDAGLR
jgi:hypothetical protein